MKAMDETIPRWRAMALPVAAAAFVWAMAQPAEAGYKIGDDEANLKLGALLQAWGATTSEAAPDGGMETEMYLRRMRIVLSGQTNDTVNFFFETDSPNFGKAGSYDVNMFMQDAWVELNVDPALQVDAGLLLVPFSHHGMQGATSLLTVDYHTALLRYPLGSNKVWRDAGFMARGMILHDIIEYRLGLFNGVHGKPEPVKVTNDAGVSWTQQADPRNPSDWPRVAARITFNGFDAEGGPGAGGFFYDGLYLKSEDGHVTSPKKVLAFGVSVDWQKDLAPDWGPLPATSGTPERPIDEVTDYYAAAADVFWDLPLDGERSMAINGQVNAYYYNYGDRRNPGSWLNEKSVDAGGAKGMFTGYGVLAEAGFRYRSVEPVVAFDWFDSTKAPGDLGDYIAAYGGFCYWLYGHETSVKVQAGASKTNGVKWIPSEIVQIQLMF